MAIRFANKEDEKRIVDFLKNNWTPNSILVTSPMIFEYQYMHRTDCGFVIAEDDDTGVIQGIKGFIPLNSSSHPDVAAALAIALKGSRPMLNMEMQRYLEKNTNCRMMCSPGLNPNTAAKVYPLFRYKVDKLKQYYRLGKCSDFRIASIVRFPEECGSVGSAQLVLYNSMEDLLKHFQPDLYQENLPYKDEQYLSYRYYEHPVYHYDVYGVETTPGVACALLMTRKIVYNESAAIRIVDFVGKRESFRLLKSGLDRLLQKENAEYVDFYCYGMPHEWMTEAGMTLRTDADENIIPNYFEPFVQRNIDIVFFCNKHENFLVCKSDGDQDRPSVLPQTII